MSKEVEIFRLYNFDEKEKNEFIQEFDEVKRDKWKAIQFALLTGFIGGHHFYMRRYLIGCVVALLSILLTYLYWPLIFLFVFAGAVECLFLPTIIKEHNESNATRIANSITLGRQIRNTGQGNSQPANNFSERIILREVVKIPCKYCSSLIENTSNQCPFCGGKLS